MYKLVIADDEPKIRKGLRNTLDWNKYDIEYVGEAEDGESAYTVFKQLKPDIMFLDICMPFLNGIDLVRKLRQENENCRIIIITGYDEFSYAQQAVKLGVFDYLLKPVSTEDLEKTVEHAVTDLKKGQNVNDFMKLMNKKSDDLTDVMTDQYFFSLISNSAAKAASDEAIILGVDQNTKVGLQIIKINKSLAFNNVEKNALCYGIRNILKEISENKGIVSCFFDNKNLNLVMVYGMMEDEYNNLCKTVIDYVESFTQSNLLSENVQNLSFDQIQKTYDNLSSLLMKKSKLRPITQSIVNYIEHHSNEKNLSLENMAGYFKMSSSYLSKIMKDEIGLSFMDFLTDIRIKNAKKLLEKPEIKIYEASEMVGYSNQYYFSRAFKKITGISPIQYKEGERNCKIKV